MRKVYGIHGICNQLIDSIFHAERFVEFPTNGAESTVCSFVRGIALHIDPNPKSKRIYNRCLYIVLSMLDFDITRRPVGSALVGLEGGYGRSVKIPGMERIMLENLQNCHNNVRTSPQNSQRLLSATLEHSMNARYTKAIRHVTCHPKRNPLGDRQKLPLNCD